MPRFLTTKQAAEEFGLSVKKFSEKIAPHLTPINLGARTRRYDIHEINQVADELLEIDFRHIIKCLNTGKSTI